MKRRKIRLLEILFLGLMISLFLWMGTEGRAEGESHLPERKAPRVLPSVLPLDLTRPPSTEALMAAGQVGGELYATHEVTEKGREAEINLSFGEAIEAWNRHQYRKAVRLFRNHVEDYPESPWASEAMLHIGCDAQYQGRYTEAEESFQWILERNTGRSSEGARRLLNKARLRLGVLKVYQNNLEEARELFSLLKQEGSDWRDRTYASHWLQRLSRYASREQSLLNCGTKALAYLLEREGREEEARSIVSEPFEAESGESLKDLSRIASWYGYSLAGVRLAPSDLGRIALPAIIPIQAKNPGDRGHYWVLGKVSEEGVELFDPQSGQRFEQSLDQFSREWSGIGLILSEQQDLSPITLTEA